MSIDDENTFNLMKKIQEESNALLEEKNNIFNASDSTIFIESYIIELIEFYNKRYTEYGNIEFKDIKPYIPFIKIKKAFILSIPPLDLRALISIINIKDENLAILIEKTDLVNKLNLPLDILNEKAFDNTDYLEESLTKSLNLNEIRLLITYSKSIFVIPAEINFITIFFNKLQAIFINYFNIIGVNPLNNAPLQFVGEDKEIYRNGNIISPDIVMSVENLAKFHKETQRRNIDILVKEFRNFYELINNPDNYLKIREKFYNYAFEHYPNLCN